MKKYKTKPEDTGVRLDKFLASKMPKFSRSQIQKMIVSGVVVVDDKKVSAHHFLKENNKIEIRKKKEEKSKKNNDIKTIKIIKNANDYLIINKPAGVLVHPDGVHNETTISDWLIKKYPKVKSVWDKQNKTGKLRPGIVHRLDRDVRGVLILAKIQAMFDHLKTQFKNRKIKKEYIALVHGNIEPEEGVIKRPMSRSKKTGLMIARTDESDENSKEAITQFEVLERFKNYTLLKIQIKTGRTHQIRVHLKSIGHSVVGDKLYQTRDLKLKKKDPIKLAPLATGHSRIFLCATKLGFEDLKGKWVEVEVKLPKELKDYLKQLK